MVSFFAGVGAVVVFLTIQAALIYVGWYFSAYERSVRKEHRHDRPTKN